MSGVMIMITNYELLMGLAMALRIFCVTDTILILSTSLVRP